MTSWQVRQAVLPRLIGRFMTQGLSLVRHVFRC